MGNEEKQRRKDDRQELRVWVELKGVKGQEREREEM